MPLSKEKHREYMRQWAKDNPPKRTEEFKAKRRELERKRRERLKDCPKNQERIKLNRKKHYETHKERLNKKRYENKMKQFYGEYSEVAKLTYKLEQLLQGEKHGKKS